MLFGHLVRAYARQAPYWYLMLSIAAVLALSWQPTAVLPRRTTLRRAAVTACSPPPTEAPDWPPPAEAPDWFVTVPRSLEAIADQAAQSVRSAIRAGRGRVLVEIAAPEFDPLSPHFRHLRLASLVNQLATPLLGLRDVLPASRPRVKLLYSTVEEATIASGASFTADLPVSFIGSPNACEPADGAFVLVAPALRGAAVPIEAAVARVVDAAAGRPVIVVNPRLGNSAALQGFEPGYLLRPLALTFRQDTYATEPTTGSGCLLRCYPHEWSVLVKREPPPSDTPGASDWFYSGRFSAQPSPQQLEAMLVDGFTRARFES
jgi:hypothetical protein